MKLRGSVFVLAVALTAPGAFAEEPSAVRSAYDNWRQSDPEAAAVKHNYIAAAATRTGPQIVVDLGLAGYQTGFTVTVKPSKRQQAVSGETIYSRAGEDAFFQLGDAGDGIELPFAQPRILIAAPEADAVLITVRAPRSQTGTPPLELIIPVTEDGRGAPSQIAVSGGLPTKCRVGCYNSYGTCSSACGLIGPKCCSLGGTILFDCVGCKVECSCGGGEE